MLMRLGTLRTPTLLFGMVAASAGAVEAIRLGGSLDLVAVSPVMLAALAFSPASAALPASACALLLRFAHSDQMAWSAVLPQPALSHSRASFRFLARRRRCLGPAHWGRARSAMLHRPEPER